MIFTAGIVNEPLVQHEIDVHNSPSKKSSVDIKERRKLAKRIIKAIQPQFEIALHAEAAISGINFEKELKKLEHLWETCLEAEAAPRKDSDGDVEMSETNPIKQNGINHTNGHSDTHKSTEGVEAVDIDMEDIDAPYDEDDIVVDVSSLGPATHAEDEGDTITTAALSEVNGNRPPVKVNGVKGGDTNGHGSGTKNGQNGVSTSPEPLVDDNPPTDNTLVDGGIPQFLQGFFNIDGTNVSEIVHDDPEGSDDLSEMDDEQVNQLVAHTERVVAAPAASPPASKSKKAKSRRRR